MINYFRLLRMKHWIKNVFIFVPPFFAGALFSLSNLPVAIYAFVSFSLCASAIYVFNDIADANNDKEHPIKKLRPIASGKIPSEKAFVFAFGVMAIAIVLSGYVSVKFMAVVSAYALLNIAYTYYLKHVLIADIFSIAAGFVLRVIGGGIAFNIPVSRWLMLTTFMVSLVLGSGKRLAESIILDKDVEKHRKVLTNNGISTLREILLISSSISLLGYSLYCLEQNSDLIYTVPFVAYGLFRYLHAVKFGLGDPTEAVINDKSIAITVIAWLVILVYIKYF